MLDSSCFHDIVPRIFLAWVMASSQCMASWAKAFLVDLETTEAPWRRSIASAILRNCNPSSMTA